MNITKFYTTSNTSKSYIKIEVRNNKLCIILSNTVEIVNLDGTLFKLIDLKNIDINNAYIINIDSEYNTYFSDSNNLYKVDINGNIIFTKSAGPIGSSGNNVLVDDTHLIVARQINNINGIYKINIESGDAELIIEKNSQYYDIKIYNNLLYIYLDQSINIFDTNDYKLINTIPFSIYNLYIGNIDKYNNIVLIGGAFDWSSASLTIYIINNSGLNLKFILNIGSSTFLFLNDYFFTFHQNTGNNTLTINKYNGSILSIK